MKTIKDVRIALWQAYRKAYQSDNDLYAKNAESICEVSYPSINHFDLESDVIPDELLEPKGLMVYNYALGPSSQHFFYKGAESSDGRNTWYSPDPFAKAVEVIHQWANEFCEGE